jgi:hypothetical protein
MGNSQCLVRATEKHGRKINQPRYIVGGTGSFGSFQGWKVFEGQESQC